VPSNDYPSIGASKNTIHIKYKTCLNAYASSLQLLVLVAVIASLSTSNFVRTAPINLAFTLSRDLKARFAISILVWPLANTRITPSVIPARIAASVTCPPEECL